MSHASYIYHVEHIGPPKGLQPPNRCEVQRVLRPRGTCDHPSCNFYHLVMTNIAMENPSSMEVLNGFNGKNIYKWAIFHRYVSHNQGVDAFDFEWF